MNEPYYKGYYMITSRCNLSCDYCVLENSPTQLRQELSLEDKKDLIRHLYESMRFRQITLSGGEALLIGKKSPSDFLELVEFIRTFGDLNVHLYTNGLLLTDDVANSILGVVKEVSVTIDSSRDAVLQRIGRSTKRYPAYVERAAEVCARLSMRGIRVKLHTVVGKMNLTGLAEEVEEIADAVLKAGGRLSSWKFYQYMSYDHSEKDRTHQIKSHEFSTCAEDVISRLRDFSVPLHFKNNQEMNDSLFNILPYGNAQYARSGDTWSTTKRTKDLRKYSSVQELFEQHDIDAERFRRFHAL